MKNPLYGQRPVAKIEEQAKAEELAKLKADSTLTQTAPSVTIPASLVSPAKKKKFDLSWPFSFFQTGTMVWIAAYIITSVCFLPLGLQEAAYEKAANGSFRILFVVVLISTLFWPFLVLFYSALGSALNFSTTNKVLSFVFLVSVITFFVGSTGYKHYLSEIQLQKDNAVLSIAKKEMTTYQNKFSKRLATCSPGARESFASKSKTVMDKQTISKIKDIRYEDGGSTQVIVNRMRDYFKTQADAFFAQAVVECRVGI